MEDSVSVAVGGSLDRDPGKCPACGRLRLFRVEREAPYTLTVFCENFRCCNWLKEVALG